jgi:hypothetical protein
VENIQRALDRMADALAAIGAGGPKPGA